MRMTDRSCYAGRGHRKEKKRIEFFGQPLISDLVPKRNQAKRTPQTESGKVNCGKERALEWLENTTFMRLPYKDHKSEAARRVRGLWNKVDKAPGKSLQALDTETESVSAVSAVKCR
jgi:hypothetical protein